MMRRWADETVWIEDHGGSIVNVHGSDSEMEAAIVRARALFDDNSEDEVRDDFRAEPVLDAIRRNPPLLRTDRGKILTGSTEWSERALSLAVRALLEAEGNP